ncbi:MAG TPA: GNAT family N-acetyltransferase [Pyrinomonadaceae bacterium]|nr:GNAT family N-acetyltransferase [Pyrinomonadaceae bacterium]
MDNKTPLAPANSDDDSHVIETDRLRLRIFRSDDLDNLAGLLADPDVMRYVEDGQPKDRDVAEKALNSIIAHWERHGFGRWVVEEKASSEFVGFGGLRSLHGTPEVVYHMAPAYWGKGYATELGRAALDFGFNERGFDRIVAIAKPDNAASVHVMEKLGMKFQQRTSYYDIEVVEYAITADEFRSMT